MMSIAVHPQVATFEPVGYVTAANITELQTQLGEAVKSPEYSMFLVDMAKVEFLDSAGLMTLVSAYRLAQNLGKRLSICSIAPSVRIIFELTQLDRVLQIFENRAAFEASLRLEEQMIA
ncbi:anti-anti-sigma factor [Aphanothece hegewaldii CCALA 016]|uniref:Anti-sigma factor antagonist n=1 Tax=Aphanothece hegewaldii CCALA 016 TaxID=2107694 RepID=A0A2T1M231_9CHRO|nr:STAS domain-containing protein [Aphanothece hegewaldii]PSF38761.1 anti-anti-sigma factor [Aphanothece hegewaldii CCALA 016]